VGATMFLLGLLELGHYGRKFKDLSKNYEAFFHSTFLKCANKSRILDENSDK
jgi:hypothetical protein